MNLLEYKEDLLEYEDDAEDNDVVRFYVGIAISCLVLLIVLFYYLGLVFGVVGVVPGDDARACNRGIGANLLLAWVVCLAFDTLEHCSTFVGNAARVLRSWSVP